MTESPPMADTNDRNTNHQPKKKKVDDQPLPPDIGLKPVQLQRRRVWRACESCRQVSDSPHRPPLVLTNSPPSVLQAQEDQVRRQRALLLPVLQLKVPVYVVADKGQGGVK